MDASTFSAIQTVQYNLFAEGTTSLQRYHHNDIFNSAIGVNFAVDNHNASQVPYP